MPNHACRLIFSRLTHRCEQVALNDQFTTEKCKFDPIWKNSPCKSRCNPRFTDFEGKSLKDCSFSVDPKRTVKLQNFGILRNFLKSFRKSSAIVGSSSETLVLGRKKISHLWLRKSWQVYMYLRRGIHTEDQLINGTKDTVNYSCRGHLLE